MVLQVLIVALILIHRHSHLPTQQHDLCAIMDTGSDGGDFMNCSCFHYDKMPPHAAKGKEGVGWFVLAQFKGLACTAGEPLQKELETADPVESTAM